MHTLATPHPAAALGPGCVQRVFARSILSGSNGSPLEHGSKNAFSSPARMAGRPEGGIFTISMKARMPAGVYFVPGEANAGGGEVRGARACTFL